MLRSLSSAISGLQSFQQRLDVIGNNIANVNTTGFKGARVGLADAFSQTLRSSSAGSGGSSGTSAMQVGLGVSIQSINNIYNQGAFVRTNVGTDLALTNNGFFVVRDPIADIEFVTRAGEFSLDESGYLVTASGMRVQGYDDTSLTTIGDIMIDTTGMPAPLPGEPTPTMLSFAIGADGKINVNLSNGSQFVRGQILLQNFSNPQGLMKEGNSLYSGIGAAGPLGGAGSPTPAPPGTNGLGTIQAGALELSNVDLATEFTNLITTQRAYQANARIITTSDEMLQELVNLKR